MFFLWSIDLTVHKVGTARLHSHRLQKDPLHGSGGIRLFRDGIVVLSSIPVDARRYQSIPVDTSLGTVGARVQDKLRLQQSVSLMFF